MLPQRKGGGGRIPGDRVLIKDFFPPFRDGVPLIGCVCGTKRGPRERRERGERGERETKKKKKKEKGEGRERNAITRIPELKTHSGERRSKEGGRRGGCLWPFFKNVKKPEEF